MNMHAEILEKKKNEKKKKKKKNDNKNDHLENEDNQSENKAEAIYGIKSFSYERIRPFHPQRLFEFLQNRPTSIVRYLTLND